ncbi:hypothetical protein SHIRM173S_13223 [Streptomyces hirsutus]
MAEVAALRGEQFVPGPESDRVEAGPIRKTRQHTAMRVWVTGADGRLSAPAAAEPQLRIMNTEHDVTGCNSTDRLAAVDGRAAKTRQAVGLCARRAGCPPRHGHCKEGEQPR